MVVAIEHQVDVMVFTEVRRSEVLTGGEWKLWTRSDCAVAVAWRNCELTVKKTNSYSVTVTAGEYSVLGVYSPGRGPSAEMLEHMGRHLRGRRAILLGDLNADPKRERYGRGTGEISV